MTIVFNKTAMSTAADPQAATWVLCRQMAQAIKIHNDAGRPLSGAY